MSDDLNTFASYFEPEEEDLAMAVGLRRTYCAFLRVGFTDEQALRMVIAAIGTVRTGG